jgi:RimJ/RimL family protein N-acetyltransferase
VQFSEQQMVVGRAPAPLARYLNFLDNGRKYSLDYADVLEHKLANAHNYGGDAGVRLEFAAKSWLLTHYMLSSEDRRKRLSRYLALVGRGMGPTAALERSFELKADDLDKLMWRYGRRGVEVRRVAQPSLPTAQPSFRTLPRTTGEFILADAALKACPSRQAGESLLKNVAALAARFPDDDLARLTLSRAQIGWGNPDEALSPLNAALEGDDANVEARYLLGLAHLRLAERSERDARRSHLEAAQLHLRRVRELSPRVAQVALAAFQAEVAAADEPASAVLTGVISAWQTARRAHGPMGEAVAKPPRDGRQPRRHPRGNAPHSGHRCALPGMDPRQGARDAEGGARLRHGGCGTCHPGNATPVGGWSSSGDAAPGCWAPVNDRSGVGRSYDPRMTADVRRLTPADAAAHRALMLQAYTDDSTSFTSSAAEREVLPLSWWAARMAEGDDAVERVFGAFVEGQLAGAAGLSMQSRPKLRHKALLFGMYVRPERRGRGLARALVEAVLAEARRAPQLQIVQLTVTQGNTAAETLYRRCGFEPWGVEPLGTFDNGRFYGKVHMACLLGQRSAPPQS